MVANRANAARNRNLRIEKERVPAFLISNRTCLSFSLPLFFYSHMLHAYIKAHVAPDANTPWRRRLRNPSHLTALAAVLDLIGAASLPS